MAKEVIGRMWWWGGMGSGWFAVAAPWGANRGNGCCRKRGVRSLGLASTVWQGKLLGDVGDEQEWA